MIPEAFLIQAIKPMVDILMNNIIKPKIDKFVETCGLKYDELFIPRGEHFEEYLYRTYKKYSIINTLVFKNERRLLRDLYIPLTLRKDTCQNHHETQIRIEGYPKELIDEYNKILITDTAGMGKSTLMKLLFLCVIENGCGIPIYIEMRRLRKDRTILHEIQEQVNSLSKEFDSKLLLNFIQTGGFIFFLDGYDEISLEERSTVTTNIQEFISKASNNVFFLTSRPEQALTCFGDFQVFTINSLNKKEAYELLRKYDKQGSTSKSLIDELKTGQYEMINEFLKNPLLVSLLFAAFDYKHTIPLKKHIFYRQVYDAYFDSHDLSKGDSYIHEKCSKLDIDDFERILRFMGFVCLKYQKIEFEKDVLLKIIGEAKEFCSDLVFSSSDFFSDIITAVPLFCKDGQYYKWVHKSLQEYFAAQFIFKDAKSNQDSILTALYNSVNIDRYINLLDLYYDIDNWGFRKNILFPLCKDYVSFYEDNIFSSNIIESADIEYRISQMFIRKSLVVRLKGACNLTPFSEVEVIARKSFDKEITSIVHFSSEGVFVANYIEPKKKLLSLLLKRQNRLFRLYDRNVILTESNLPFNEAIKIDIHTCEEDRSMYKYINFYLGGGAGIGNLCYSFVYGECKNECIEIERIKKSKEEASNLIDGL